MLAHLRANLWLLGLTVVLCCVLYPLALWGIGQAAFPEHANGSLVYDANGKAIASRLIAHEVKGDEFFQPRPSAAGYNGAASGASNWGANNYLLRDRVARTLGPVVRYAAGPKKGQPVGPDVEAWFRSQPDLVARWAESHSTLAQNWVKADKLNAEYVASWQNEHAAEVHAWIKENPSTPEPKPEDLAVVFFKSYAKTFPGTWPVAVDYKTPDGKTEKRIEPATEGTDIHSVFFDLWRQKNADTPLADAPADMVMASGSGLDPHITMDNAHYQLDRVVNAWAAKTKGEPGQIRREVETILTEHQHRPMGGLAGVPLLNVVEVNLALSAKFTR